MTLLVVLIIIYVICHKCKQIDVIITEDDKDDGDGIILVSFTVEKETEEQM